jgi:hypothetical protein
MRQTILPWYGAVPGDASVCITKHVPYFVSIVSPTTGSRGNSTSSKSSQVGASILILNRLMGHMMQDPLRVATPQIRPAAPSASVLEIEMPPTRIELVHAV